MTLEAILSFVNTGAVHRPSETASPPHHIVGPKRSALIQLDRPRAVVVVDPRVAPGNRLWRDRHLSGKLFD
ncbi:hypothetical protein [Burkholderia sp. F1]|uniref:hypothetical protein n=1 Tax=Burkholderia sp. F1 TaxID=3366817 RepID=UPI003D715D88